MSNNSKLEKFKTAIHSTAKAIARSNLQEKKEKFEKISKPKILSPENEEEILEARVLSDSDALKIKYSDFVQQTRSKTGKLYIATKDRIFEEAKNLLYQERLENSVRLIGISLSNLNTKKSKEQPSKKLPKLEQLSLPF